MAFKVFLDVNVLVSAYLPRQTSADCQALMEQNERGEIKAFTTPSVLHITHYFLQKHFSKSKLRALLQSIVAEITIIELNHQHAIQAMHSTIEDVEDALQYFAAIQHRLDYFISDDKALRKAALPQIPVLSPARFFQLYF